MRFFHFILTATFFVFPLTINQSIAQAIPDIRITSVTAYDEGELFTGTPTFTIDVQQDECDSDNGPADLEPFFDTFVGLTIKNESDHLVRLKSFSYRLRVPGIGVIRSRKRALAGIGEIGPDEEGVEVLGALLSVSDTQKVFLRNDIPVPADLGTVNVTMRLVGTDDTGRRVRLKASTALAFQNLDRCE